MLQINGKTFMNLQEAVQWLLDNNALPFQSSANYVANTEIGMGTIVNPSPAKVRIGSLIFFADSKVSTVIGLTENGFMVSDQYNDLVDDVVYVSNVALNASGHLIVTLSNGDTIDAGLIKQVSNFSINGSQHLIASYNDGSTTDLGAIFSGNINVSGNLSVSGGISGNAITGDSIIENMSGYSITLESEPADVSFTEVYSGICKNGNKLTLVHAFKVTVTASTTEIAKCRFIIPSTVGAKIFGTTIAGGSTEWLDIKNVPALANATTVTDVIARLYKNNNTRLDLQFRTGNLSVNTEYYIRYEGTILLSDNLNP